MKVDPRFLTSAGPDIFTGSELLLKGALETEGGVHLLGGYPGSPIADFFNSMAFIKDLLQEKGIRAVINNNEALAAAALNGSQLAGCRGMAVMKSVGVHVAADALALGNLAGAHPRGGAVVVYGDDPWSDSTQVAADSRYISKHLHIPVIEPANPQEVKDFVDLSFKLSAASELYAGYVLTTNLADGGGTVTCRPNRYPQFNTRRQIELKTGRIDLDKFVLLPPRTWWQEESLSDRFQRAVAASRSLGLNRILHPAKGPKPIGFATSGLAHEYLLQALFELGLLGEQPILKFGLSYPVDAELVRRLAEQCERILVVEERRGFMEEQLSEIILKDRQEGLPSGRAEVWGKRFPDGLAGIPAIRGLHPSILIERLVPVFKKLSGRGGAVPVAHRPDTLDREIRRIDTTERTEVAALPVRLATFCAGCPHRDSANVCLEIKKRFMDGEYMRRAHKRGPVDLMFHGDTGCYTMLMYPPNTPLMHDYSGMGLGGGTGSGIDPFITNKQAVFMGDSTFFHSGQIAISQAIKLGQDITFIILDNSTTGMTGHQPTPGVNYDILGQETPVQDIQAIVLGMATDGGVPVVRADPEKRKQYARLLESTFLADGVKVVIATKECAITRGRRKRSIEREIQRAKGFLPTWEHMNINQEVCRFCLACVEMTGCPGLKHVRTDYGPKMDTDITACVNDGACERIRACNSFERVTIKRKRRPRSRVPQLGLDEIPEPPKRPAGDVWRGCLVGVGGMGIGVGTRILVRAGHMEGYTVRFLDKKGLAIRSGGVVSQVVYNIADKPITAVIPYGKADLLIGIDILEAARALDPGGRSRIASRDRTAAVINTAKVATIVGLMGQEDFDPAELETLIRQYTRSDDFLARDISRICEKYLGSRLFANIMMLGFAFQKGLIPVSMHSMAWAIKDTLRTEVRKNLYAFNMGRKLVVQDDLFQGPPVRTGWKETLEDKCRHTIRRYRRGRRLADQLRELVAGTVGATANLDEELHRDLVIRCYDCMRWAGIPRAKHYADQVLAVYEKDTPDQDYAATRAVVHNLAAATLIKDPVFCAELATSPEKRAQDREKYNVNPANGDRIRYRYLWHHQLRIGPWKLRWDMTMHNWMLQALKRMRWLRKLLPAWGADERKFLEGYEAHVAAFAWNTTAEYRSRLAQLSSPKCMDCLNPRCQEAGCPLAGDIPKWLLLSYWGRWREAAGALHADNNFPELTSRVCPAPCQSACKQALNGLPVQIRDVERRIIERAFAAGWVVPEPAEVKTGRRVAIIGSGPAGLAAAQQLARRGHDVVVFEKDDAPGGLLRYGIPDRRLEKDLVARRLAQLEAEGVRFRTGVQVGKDIPAGQIRDRFDAVLLATGAAAPKDLKVQGRDSPGIHFAMDFLRQANRRLAGRPIGDRETILAKDKVVAVVGGGLTGHDCVQTALDQGAKEIHQFEILPKAEDQIPLIDEHDPEEVIRQWCVATKAFRGDGRGLTELQAVRVQWINSAHGPVMKELPESEFRMKIDMALLALGFDPVVDPDIAAQLGLETDEDGRIAVNDHATEADGVFAAGDLATGPAYIVTAISSGRSAAQRIDEYLQTPADAAAPAAAAEQ